MLTLPDQTPVVLFTPPAALEAIGYTGLMCLPRSEVSHVGFAHHLGMPKRPAWRGVVRSAEELHALEERAFDEWKQVGGWVCVCSALH